MRTPQTTRLLVLGLGWSYAEPSRRLWAVDTDGDGVDDSIDVCNNTPSGIAVDAEGRPLGDIDRDCDTDLSDFTLFQQNMTGPLSTPLGMIMVSGGEFEMGDPWAEYQTDELPVHAVYLSPYYIDTFEVTNQQYANALNWAWAQGGLIEVTGGVVYKAADTEPYCDTSSASVESRIHWDGATFSITAGKEDHPMVRVSWYGAVAYANWRSAMEGKPSCYDLSTWSCDFGVAGYRLPTEAEWEKAASWNPITQYHYRFGEHTDGCGPSCLDAQRANYWESADPFETGDEPWTTPVGYYDGSDHGGYQTQNALCYYGCYDMSGNVCEWCYDWGDSNYYSAYPPDGWPPDPTGPETGSVRVIRGGGWGNTLFVCRTADRAATTPDIRHQNFGFRCVLGTP